MPDTMLALVNRSRLSALLTAFHREGYGQATRVFDPERAPLANQLGRAGVQSSRMATEPVHDVVLLFVQTPGRTTEAAALAVTHGAHDVELVTCGTAVSAAVAPGLIAFAGNRRGRRRHGPVEAIPSGPADVVERSADLRSPSH